MYNVVHRFGLISLRGGRLPQKISGPSSPYIYTHPTKNHLKPGSKPWHLENTAVWQNTRFKNLVWLHIWYYMLNQTGLKSVPSISGPLVRSSPVFKTLVRHFDLQKMTLAFWNIWIFGYNKEMFNTFTF